MLTHHVPPASFSMVMYSRYVQALKIDRVSSFHDDAAFHAPQVGKLKRTMSNFANRVRDPVDRTAAYYRQ